jgi:hypothetical protein
MINRTFDLKPLAGSRIAGMLLLFKYTGPHASVMPLILTLAVFATAWMLLKSGRFKFPRAFAYLLLFSIICSFTAVFTAGLGIMAGRSISDAFFGGFDPSNLYKYLNVSVLAIFFAVFLVLILCSVVFLFAEFYAVLEEEYGHLPHYRKFIRRFFCYKARTTPRHIEDIKRGYAKLCGQDLQSYHIIEIIQAQTGLSEAEIASVLADNEADERTKFGRIHRTLHDKALLEKLHTCIRRWYWRQRVPLALIVERCRTAGYCDDDIAAASLHMRHKKKDRVIFREMKKALYY